MSFIVNFFYSSIEYLVHSSSSVSMRILVILLQVDTLLVAGARYFFDRGSQRRRCRRAIVTFDTGSNSSSRRKHINVSRPLISNSMQ